MLSAYDATTTFPIFRPTYIQPFCVDNIQKNLKKSMKMNLVGVMLKEQENK